MAGYSSHRQGSSPFKLFAMVVIVLVLGGTGSIAALWASGLIDLPFLKAHKEPSREGWVLVSMSGRLIPAFTLIHRDDLANPETHLWNDQWIPKGALPENVVTDRSKIIGRVLNHDKAPGYVFTEDDFMPVGTRSGIVAAIPPGKRSLTFESSKISGIHRLRMGDRFDVVGTLPLPKNQPAPQGRGAAAVPRPKPEVLVLVRDGMLISAAQVRPQATSSQSLVSGQRTSLKPVEEVMIALDPEEIPELTAAMAMDASITVVARSGHPDDAKVNSETPNSQPVPPPTMIETVIGGKRETIYFPGASDRPERLPDDGSAPSLNLPAGVTEHDLPRDEMPPAGSAVRRASHRDERSPRGLTPPPRSAMVSE